MIYELKCQSCGVIGELEEYMEEFECPLCSDTMFPMSSDEALINAPEIVENKDVDVDDDDAFDAPTISISRAQISEYKQNLKVATAIDVGFGGMFGSTSTSINALEQASAPPPEPPRSVEPEVQETPEPTVKQQRSQKPVKKVKSSKKFTFGKKKTSKPKKPETALESTVQLPVEQPLKSEESLSQDTLHPKPGHILKATMVRPGPKKLDVADEATKQDIPHSNTISKPRQSEEQPQSEGDSVTITAERERHEQEALEIAQQIQNERDELEQQKREIESIERRRVEQAELDTLKREREELEFKKQELELSREREELEKAKRELEEQKRLTMEQKNRRDELKKEREALDKAKRELEEQRITMAREATATNREPEKNKSTNKEQKKTISEEKAPAKDDAIDDEKTPSPNIKSDKNTIDEHDISQKKPEETKSTKDENTSAKKDGNNNTVRTKKGMKKKKGSSLPVVPGKKGMTPANASQVLNRQKKTSNSKNNNKNNSQKNSSKKHQGNELPIKRASSKVGNVPPKSTVTSSSGAMNKPNITRTGLIRMEQLKKKKIYIIIGVIVAIVTILLCVLAFTIKRAASGGNIVSKKTTLTQKPTSLKSAFYLMINKKYSTQPDLKSDVKNNIRLLSEYLKKYSNEDNKNNKYIKNATEKLKTQRELLEWY